MYCDLEINKLTFLWSIILAVVYCKLTEKPLIQPLRCIGLDSVHLICGRAVWLGSDIAGDLDPSENKSAHLLDKHSHSYSDTFDSILLQS